MMRWYALAAAVVALDQASKWTVLAQVEYGRSIPVLPFLYWTHTCNTGVAFSMFQGYGSIFALVAVVVAALLGVRDLALAQRLGGRCGLWIDPRRRARQSGGSSATRLRGGFRPCLLRLVQLSSFQRGRQRHHARRCVLDRLRGDRINPRRSSAQGERRLLTLEPGYAAASSGVCWAIAARPLRPPPSPTRRGTMLWCSHFSDHRTRSQQALVRLLRRPASRSASWPRPVPPSSRG